MQKRIDNVIRVSTTLDNVFLNWMIFLKPFHHLAQKELEVTACLLKHRYQLSKVVQDNKIFSIDEMLLSKEIKDKVKAECSITSAYFMVILSRLRKNKVIIDGRINPKFIPNIKEIEDTGTNTLQLLLLFEFKDADKDNK